MHDYGKFWHTVLVELAKYIILFRVFLTRVDYAPISEYSVLLRACACDSNPRPPAHTSSREIQAQEVPRARPPPGSTCPFFQECISLACEPRSFDG